MKSRFLKKISIYFIGTLSSNVINILLVPVYAYFVSAEDLGEYDYILSIGTMVTPIVYLVIWEAILKYCISDESKDVNKYLSTAFAFSGIVSCLCIIIFAILVTVGTSKDILLLMGLIIILDGLTFLWQFSTRALGESKHYVIAGVLGSVVVIGCDLIYIVCGSLNYVGLAVSHILSQMIIIIVLEKKVHLLCEVKIKYVDIAVLKRMLRFSAPLVLNTVCMWFYSGGNKIIVRNFIGATENGLYAFAAKFSILINFCSTIVSMAVIEEAYSFGCLEEYRRKVGKLISIISKAYFSMIALALPSIYLLYSIAFKNTEYYESSDYVFILLLSALFTALSNNFGSSFQVTENTKLIFLTTIAGAMSSLGVSILLVNKCGIWGILLGSVIGPLVMMIMRAVYAQKATGLEISWQQNSVIFAMSVIICIVLNKFDSILIQVLVLLLVLTFLLYIYRKEISVIYKNMTHS